MSYNSDQDVRPSPSAVRGSDTESGCKAGGRPPHIDDQLEKDAMAKMFEEYAWRMWVTYGVHEGMS